MTTFVIQLFVALLLSSFIVFALTLWLTKRSLQQRQSYLESFLEIIPRDIVSHSDRDVIEPKPPYKLDVRTTQFIR